MSKSIRIIIEIMNRLLQVLLKIKKYPRYILKKIKNSLPKPLNYFIKSNYFFKKIIMPIVLRNTVRWYINPIYTIESFFKELNNRNIHYVVLRWWETLPAVDNGEDIDMLISDDDLLKIKDLITKVAVGQKLDLYTIKGRNGGAYNGTPYYPIKLSEDLLTHRVLFKNNYYVPNDEYYFYSLAYHAIFHKGINSGLMGFKSSLGSTPEHDYNKFLRELSQKINLDIQINLNSINEVLKEKKYYPTIDSLTRISDFNSSVEEMIPSLCHDVRGGEVCMFVIRERALIQNKLDIIKEQITMISRMKILDTIVLTNEQKEYLKYNMRSSIWNKGPYALSGGNPELIILAYDYHPTVMPEDIGDNYRFFTNYNLLKCKFSIRNVINREKLIMGRYNAVHTTDNETEALFFLKRIVSKKKYTVYTNKINNIRNEYKTDYSVVKVLSTGRRSKVELIYFNNELAIKKTFRKEYRRFLEREEFAHQELSKKITNIPKLYKIDNNFIITKYYDEVVGNKKVNILKNKKVEVFKIINELYQNGYAHVNLTLDNILVTKNKELYVIDFEFLYKYEQLPNTFLESYDIIGVPKDLKIDLPEGYNKFLNSYSCKWKKIIG